MYEQYQILHRQYFDGDLSVEALLFHVGNLLSVEVNQTIEFPDEPCMIISNHPKCDPRAGLQTRNLGSLKGHNYYQHNTLWFPTIREIVMQHIIPRPFKTLARPIGYDIGMQELGCLLLPPGHGVTHTTHYLKRRPHLSCLIYPEGGFNRLFSQSFRNGFYHIARNVGYAYIVWLIIDPILGLYRRNRVTAMCVEPVPHLPESTQSWVTHVQNRYIANTNQLYQEFNLE
ncbi:MAG: hypothetical protein BRC23_02000 [Parcubacteria group bacterium SW_4_49_11]|nr:MAG: hypothetical protein BRC23_02000 [Parcubacteria group bacterium SW_4_49_11]